MKRWLGAVAAVVLAGCGGDSPGEVTGAVAGRQMTDVQDAIYLPVPMGPAAGGASMGMVIVSDLGGLCDRLQGDASQGTVEQDASLLMLMLGRVQGETLGAVDPGDYPVVSSDFESSVPTDRFAVAMFQSFAAGAMPTGEETAGQGTGGAVTLASVEAQKGGGAAGTFDLQFGSDTLKGRFDADYCDSPVFAVDGLRRLTRAAQ